MTWRRAAVLAVLFFVALGVGAPFLNGERFREHIEAALQRSLQRKVEIGRIRFDLFTGPGFTLEAVTIHEDPRVGIEPMAYVETVHARLGLLRLFTGRLSFSNLRLVEPSLNLAKGDGGLWNFQLLLEQRGSNPPDSLPSIQVRDGRINFKFGDNKSTFYLTGADVDFSASREQLDFRFSGEPARTDRSAQSFGRLLFRGAWKRKAGAESQLDVNAELERSAISEAVKLAGGHVAGLHGIVASRAHIEGPISALNITGQLRLEDIHRWDSMPNKTARWNLNYKGTLDLWNQRLRVATLPGQSPELPVLVRFEAAEYLGAPRWAVTAEFRDMPSASLLEVARHMSAPLPPGAVADGTVAGMIGYSGAAGLQGQLRFEGAALKLPSGEPIRFQTADVLLDSSRIALGPATVQIAPGQTAEVEAVYYPGGGDFDMKISTAGMDIAELHSGTAKVLGAGALPVLRNCRQGVWRGWVAYTRTAERAGAWTGETTLQNVRVDLPAVAEPVRIASATLAISGDRYALTRIRGTAGDIAFTGDLRSPPNRLNLHLPELTPERAEALFLPVLRRRESLLARTLRFGRSTAPEWLRSRRLEANLQVDRLLVGGEQWKLHAARLVWNGTDVRIGGIDAHAGRAAAMGAVTVNLAGSRPAYTAQGRIEGLPFKDGLLTLEGGLTAGGLGAELKESAEGEGTFTGEGIAFSADNLFESISGAFAVNPDGRLKLTDVQITQGPDTFTGQGSTQSDGRLLLELTNTRRQLRLLGTSLAPQPVAAR